MKLIYLAQPYTSEYPDVRADRARVAAIVTARLICGEAVFSPIVHGHNVEPHITRQIVNAHKFWMSQCIPILRRCDEMYVLPLDGWRESRGLKDELAICKQLHIPVSFLVGHSLSMLNVWEEFCHDIPTEVEAVTNNWKFNYV